MSNFRKWHKVSFQSVLLLISDSLFPEIPSSCPGSFPYPQVFKMLGNPSFHQRLCWPSESEWGQGPSALTHPPAHSIRRRQLTTWVTAGSKQRLLHDRSPWMPLSATEGSNIILMTFMVARLILVWVTVEETQLMWRERSCCSTMTHGLSSQHKVQVCFAFLWL